MAKNTNSSYKTNNKTSKSKRSYANDFQSMQRKRLWMAVGFLAVLLVLAVTATIPWWLVGWYLLINAITFAIYAKDKQAAQTGQWRTPEKSLHVLAVAGGWVGAMLAQTYLRHKSKKTEFRVVYYLTVLLNLLGLLAVMAGQNPLALLNRLI